MGKGFSLMDGLIGDGGAPRPGGKISVAVSPKRPAPVKSAAPAESPKAVTPRPRDEGSQEILVLRIWVDHAEAYKDDASDPTILKTIRGKQELREIQVDQIVKYGAFRCELLQMTKRELARINKILGVENE